MIGGLSDPLAVQKLIRHFASDTGLRVALDYAEGAIPRTAFGEDGSIQIHIPAWLRAEDLDPLLAACLHESGHAEFDKKGNAELSALMKKAALPGWGAFLHNVVTDARIDKRRVDAYPGGPGLYSASWRRAEARHVEMIGKMTAQQREGVRIVETCIGALGRALGMESQAPTLCGSGSVIDGHPKAGEIVDLLRGCPGSDGSLLPEMLRLLALLALDGKPMDQPPPPPAPAPGESADTGSASPTPAPPPAPSTSGESESDALRGFEGDTGRLVEKPKGVKGAIRDPKFQDRLRRAANRVFKGQEIRDMEDGGAGGGSGQGASGSHGGIAHTSPSTFGDAITPFSRAEFIRARGDLVADGVRAFVESALECPGDDDYRYKLDQDRIAGVLADPPSVLVGDTSRRASHAAVDVVLDVSGSMESQMTSRGGGKPQSRMSALLAALNVWAEGVESLAASGVAIGIRLFASDTTRHVEFTDISGIDRRALTGAAIEATSARGGCGGGTNCRRGLEASINDLQAESARRRAILLITDGAIFQEDADWIAKEWPDGIGLAVLAVSEDADGLAGTGEAVFRFKALTVDEVAPMLATALRESVESQAAR